MSDLRIEKLSMGSTDITQESINKIKELFPQVVTEGKIDFEVLKTILGEQIEERTEKYQFTWNGKSDTIRFAQKPSTGTLRPDKESSKNWDTTENLYIEGDNLEVLKLLQKTYHNKIKMIYIDPPYNTGGDFVYKDDFKDSIKNYKEQTNQTLRTNPETSGRYHTDWLNMMYSRLMLAKNLLTEDGVIFISIDDNEADNLKKICDEVFGENNFISRPIRRKNKLVMKGDKTFKNVLEPLLVYAKNTKNVNFQFNAVSTSTSDFSVISAGYGIKQVNFKENQLKFNIQSEVIRKGEYGNLILVEDIIVENHYNSNPVSIIAEFKWSENNIQEKLKNGAYILIRNSTKMNPRIYFETSTSKPLDYIDEKYGKVTNEDGLGEIKKLNLDNIFSYPKPLDYLKFLVNIVNDTENIVLDFFSGSSTTAHAVMQLNAEDGGNRKFIMVQLPEKTDEKSEAFKAGYSNICEIGKERIRRAGEKIKNELVEKNQKAGMLEDSIDPDKLDIGFKVYKLDSSNFNVFDSSSKDINNIFNHDVFLSDRSKLDILYEILLKYGIFDKPVEVLNLNKKEAYSLAYGHMIVFINQEITEQDITDLLALKPREVIIDERGFKTDNDKMNAVIRLEAAGVEKISTI